MRGYRAPLKKLLTFIALGVWWGWGLIPLLAQGGAAGEPMPPDRPFNLINLRNFRIDFTVPSARALAMGGAGIGLSDDPSSMTLNPAGVRVISRPAIASSTRLSGFTIREPLFEKEFFANTEKEPFSEPVKDLFVDQTLLAASIPWGRVRLLAFRETVLDKRFNLTARLPFRVQAVDTTGLTAQDGEATLKQWALTHLGQNFSSRKTQLQIQIIDNSLGITLSLSSRFGLGIAGRLTQLTFHLAERQYFPTSVTFPVVPSQNTEAQYELESENLYRVQTIDEKRWDLSWTLGFQARLDRRLLVGAVVNLRPTFRLNALDTFTQFRFAGSVEGAGESAHLDFERREIEVKNLRLNIPDSYGIGLLYRSNRRIKITADVLYIRYSELLKALDAVEKKAPLNLIQDDDLELLENGDIRRTDPDNSRDVGLSDKLEIHAGVEYLWKFRRNRVELPMLLRGGYYFEPGHIIHAVTDRGQDEVGTVITASYPRARDRHHLTLGIGYPWSRALRLDLALDLTVSPAEAAVLVISSYYQF